MDPQLNNNLVNVVDPNSGQVGSIPKEQLSEAMNAGFTQATPEQVDLHFKKQKYGTLPQKLLTGLEGIGKGSSFGLSKGIETSLGVPLEDIEGREEINKPWDIGGQALGLSGSSLIGVGEGELVARAGQGAVEYAGLKGAESGLAKIGSTAVREATETALVQSGNEVSKMISSNPSNDPNEAIQTAVTNIGLAGLMGAGGGAAVGAISPLWKATAGPKVGQTLQAVSNRMNGIEGVVPDAMAQAIETSGVKNIPPEIKAALSDNPRFQQWYKELEQTDTNASGFSVQKTSKALRKDFGDTLVESLGKSPEEVGALGEFSKYEAGKSLGETLATELKEQTGPIAEKFEKLKAKYADVELPKGEVIPAKTNVYGQVESAASKLPGFTDQLADRISQLAEQQGWNTMSSSDIMSSVRNVLKDLPQLKKLSDLTKFISQVGSDTYDFTNPSLTRAGMMMKGVLKDAEGDLVAQKLGEEGPHLLEEHQLARSAWKAAVDLKESLDSRLHVGGGDSIGSFIKNLKGMSLENGERIFQRLSGKNDAQVLSLLAEKFPKTAALLKQYHIEDLLRASASKAAPGETINSKALMTAMGKISPELKNFIASPAAQKQIDAIGLMTDHLDSIPHNFSNTARTWAKLSQYIPGSAIAMISLMEHSAVGALVLAPLTKFLGKDGPDAIKLGLLKFLGSNKPIDSEGFKAAVDFIEHTMKGENLVSKATQSLFKSGALVLPQAVIPSDKDLEKLDKHLKTLREDPSPLFDIGGKTTHYLDNHGPAMGQTAATAVNYLNGMRPVVGKASPLDVERKPSKAEEAMYQRQLTIAQQPLMVLGHIKDGTLTSQDVKTFETLYPALKRRLENKIMDQMIGSVHLKETIPYKTRMGLSLFLGQPLDSTLTPRSILSAQPKPAPMPQPMPGMPKLKHSMNSLNKMPSLMQTGLQARESARSQ